MLLRNWQLILAGIWAALALFLIFVEQQWQTPASLFAGVLAIWNLMRWAMQRKRSREAYRPLERKSDPAPYEYNAELDFQKMEREQGERGA